MQRESERLVLFFDLTIEGYSVARKKERATEGLNPKPLTTLLSWVEAAHKAGDGKLAWKRRDNREVVYLADIEVDEEAGQATLLINRCDKRASDIVFFNPDSDTRRRIQREPGEGADYSCHIVISLRQHRPNQYLVLLEQSPGLSGGRMQAFFTYLFRVVGALRRDELRVRHPSGITFNGKPYFVQLRHRCKLDGHPSQSFLQDLESGKIGQMELISTREKNNPWDANGYIVEQSRIVKVTPIRTGIVGSKIDTIRGLCNEAAQNNYANVKVRFKTDTNLNRTVMLDAQTGNIAHDSLYVRREIIDGFVDTLPSAFERVHEEVKGKLEELLRGN